MVALTVVKTDGTTVEMGWKKVGKLAHVMVARKVDKKEEQSAGM